MTREENYFQTYFFYTGNSRTEGGRKFKFVLMPQTLCFQIQKQIIFLVSELTHENAEGLENLIFIWRALLSYHLSQRSPKFLETRPHVKIEIYGGPVILCGNYINKIGYYMALIFNIVNICELIQ